MTQFSDKRLLPQFDSIKDDNENVLWIDKPKLIPYIITSLSLGVAVTCFLVFYFVITKDITFTDKSIRLLSIIGASLPVLFFLWSFVRKMLSYKNTAYALTDKRIIIRSGFLSPNFKIMDYAKIIEVDVKINLIERAYNVGTIIFFSGKTEQYDDFPVKVYDKWEAINMPNDVFDLLRKVSVHTGNKL
jgi:uncharacterized membrane protein YdbT with pleckstrin-like domain